MPEGTCPALDAALRAPLAKVVGGLGRFQALVEEVCWWLGERRGTEGMRCITGRQANLGFVHARFYCYRCWILTGWWPRMDARYV